MTETRLKQPYFILSLRNVHLNNVHQTRHSLFL